MKRVELRESAFAILDRADGDAAAIRGVGITDTPAKAGVVNAALDRLRQRQAAAHGMLCKTDTAARRAT